MEKCKTLGLFLILVLCIGVEINCDSGSDTEESTLLDDDILVEEEESTPEDVRERPGFKGRITQKGMDYAASLAINILMKELTKLEIPDVNERMGMTDVSVYDIKVDDLPRPDSSLTTIPWPGYGLRWSATNLNPTISANYLAEMDFGLWTITKRGTATFIAEELHFTLDFFFGSDPQGYPTTEVLSCDCQGDIDISFEGQWSDILNVGSTLFNSQIENLITAQICFQAKKEINAKLGSALQKLPLTPVIYDDYMLDLTMANFPQVREDALEIGLKGSVLLADGADDFQSFPPILRERPDDDDRMVYLYLTDYTVNSGFYATFLNGLLAYNITSDMVPEEYQGYLNTSCGTELCLGTVFPQAAAMHPNGVAAVEIQASSPPTINTQGSDFNVTASGIADVFVIEDGHRTSLFEIGINISGAFNVSIVRRKVIIGVINIEFESSSAGVEASNIGDIGTGFFFESILRVVSQQVLIPRITEIGQEGILIPKVKGIEFLQPLIVPTDQQGVFIIASDLGYETRKKRARKQKKKRQSKRKLNRN